MHTMDAQAVVQVAAGTVLWFGRSVEPRPGLLKRERDIFAEHGFGTVRAMENALVDNVRKALADTSPG